MNTYEAITTRRSTRKFLSKAIEKDKLEKVIEAGRMAPSGSNSQQNHFLVISDSEVLAKLTAMVQAAFAKMEVDENTYISLRNSVNLSKKGNYVFHYAPPTLVVVANNKDYGNNQADASIALENMMLEANELDLGTCYINQLRWLNEDPEIVEYLQHLGMKENERVYASMSIGYPDTEDGLPVRKPLIRKGNEVTWI